MAELREQGVDLGAVMRLVIEEMRQQDVQRIFRLDARVIELTHALVVEAVGQLREEALDAPVQLLARGP